MILVYMYMDNNTALERAYNDFLLSHKGSTHSDSDRDSYRFEHTMIVSKIPTLYYQLYKMRVCNCVCQFV